MVTLNSKNEDIIKEVFRSKHEMMWHYKHHHGGLKRYERMRDNLLAKAMKDKETQFGDVYDYITKDGNRWRIFEHAHYFPESDGAYINDCSFIYYETYGSCGAFVPYYGRTDKKKGVVIFTSHFFLRMCQRLKVEYRSSAMIQSLLEMLPSLIVMPKDSKRAGMNEVSVGLPGSVGNGVIRYDDGETYLLEIRSFLTNPELDGKQKREVASLHKAQKVVKYEPQSMQIARYDRMILNEGLADGVKHMTEDVNQQLIAMGHDKRVVKNNEKMYLWVMSIVGEQIGNSVQPELMRKRSLNAQEEVQGIYDACCRRILFHEDWMSEPLDVLMHAGRMFKRLTLRDMDYYKAYQSLCKATGFAADQSREVLEKALKDYEQLCNDFDIKHMKK